MQTKESERRRNFRFQPDPLAYALIDKEPEKDGFEPVHIGLIINESYGGCDLAVLLECGISEGDQLKIKLGESGVMKAEVSWQRTLDYKVSRIGLQYL